MKAPPPNPELCGSIRPRVAWIATAASTAPPPARRIFSPASTASGLAAAIIPPVAAGALAAATRAGGGLAAQGAPVASRAARAIGTNEDFTERTTPLSDACGVTLDVWTEPFRQRTARRP